MASSTSQRGANQGGAGVGVDVKDVAPADESRPQLPDRGIEGEPCEMADAIVSGDIESGRCQATRLGRLPWVISTPLGVPVVPEV